MDPLRSALIVALLPILVMWLGIGEAMKVVFLFLGAVVYLIPMVRDAIVAVPSTYWISARERARPAMAARDFARNKIAQHKDGPPSRADRRPRATLNSFIRSHRMHPLKGMLLILFAPRTFTRAATRESCPDGILPESQKQEFETTVRNQTQSIRRAILGGVGVTLLTMLVGYGAGFVLQALFGTPSKVLVYLLQALGAGVILGATLGEIDREIQTWDRVSLAEKINAFMFRALYVLGTFLFVTSVTWDAT